MLMMFGRLAEASVARAADAHDTWVSWTRLLGKGQLMLMMLD